MHEAIHVGKHFAKLLHNIFHGYSEHPLVNSELTKLEIYKAVYVITVTETLTDIY